MNQRARLVVILVVAVIVTACGKKGNPIPPFSHVPAAPKALTIQRLMDDVYVSFTVPEIDIDQSPADVARVDVYAYTATRPLRSARDLVLADLVASVPVLPRPKDGSPEPSAAAADAAQAIGVMMGAPVTVVETLSARALTPIVVPSVGRRREEIEAAPDEDLVLGPAGAVVPIEGDRPERFYVAVAVSRHGHRSPSSETARLSLVSEAPGAPVDLSAQFTAAGIALAWMPPDTGARGPVQRAPAEPPAVAPAAIPAEPDTPAPAARDVPWLPSKPLVSFAAPFGDEWTPTRYNVYVLPPRPVASGMPAPAVTPWHRTPPTPVNAAPLAVTMYTDPEMMFGMERCYVVRAINRFGSATWEGSASTPACVTPQDIFPPPPPQSLAAVASAGAISLIWQASPAIDVAGYVVLRGAAGSATLQRLTPAPIAAARYRDESVSPGARYVYAVVAVDAAGNESDASNRVEAVVPQG